MTYTFGTYGMIGSLHPIGMAYTFGTLGRTRRWGTSCMVSMVSMSSTID